MTSGRRLVAQTGIQFAGKIVSVALGVVAIAIITRVLGLEGFGWYATVMAYLQFFGIAVDLGLNVMAPTMLGERRGGPTWPPVGGDVAPPLRDNESACILSNIFTIRLTVAVVVFALAAVVALFIPAYTLAVRAGIALAAFSFLAIVLTQILQAPFQVAARMVAPTIADVVGRAVLVIGVAYAAWAGLGLYAIIVATVFGNIVTFAMAFAAARLLVPIRLAFDFTVWRQILERSWPIGLSIIFNLVYLRADIVILSLLRTADEVGIYAAPYRLIDVLTQLPHLAMGLVLPVLAGAWAIGDRATFTHRLQRAFDGLALIGVPFVAGAIVLGTPIMALVAGSPFAISGPVLGVLAFALLGIFLGQPFGYAVVAVGAQKKMMWGYAVVAVFTLAGYLIFIPKFSYWGAAWMTVASEIAIAVITYQIVRRATGLRLSLHIVASSFLASVVMAGAILVSPISLIPRIALGAIVYGLVVFALPPTRHIISSVAFSPSHREGE
ncbi:MAG: flippase [Candidatus Uhrbacteria bacterium]